MGDNSSVNIQDDWTTEQVSVVESDDDATINSVVVVNPDWSSIW